MAVALALATGDRIGRESSSRNHFCTDELVLMSPPLNRAVRHPPALLLFLFRLGHLHPLLSKKKKRAAYQRFFNDTLLARDPPLEHASFSPSFPCPLPTPLPPEPELVARLPRVGMPTLCRLDFGLPLPPEPPLEAEPQGQPRSFPPPPVPPPPPYPPGPPLLPDNGGGAGYYLTRQDRNRIAHANNGNTSSVASAPSVGSSSQSQRNYRSFLSFLPAESAAGHFEWFRELFSWPLVRFGCVGCVSEHNEKLRYEGYVQLTNVRSSSTLASQSHSFQLVPVTASFQLSNFRYRFPADAFMEFGTPHPVRASPIGRTNSLSNVSCLSFSSPIPSSASSQRVRRWSSLTLTPEFAATVGSAVAAVSFDSPHVVDSVSHSRVPSVHPSGQSVSQPPALLSANDVGSARDIFSPSRPLVRPPTGFRGYPVLPRYPRSSAMSPTVPFSHVTPAESSVIPESPRPRARSASPFTARSRPLGSRPALSTFPSAANVFHPYSQARDPSADSATSLLSRRRSSSAPCGRSRVVPSASVQPCPPPLNPPVARPSQAPAVVASNDNPQNIPDLHFVDVDLQHPVFLLLFVLLVHHLLLRLMLTQALLPKNSGQTHLIEFDSFALLRNNPTMSLEEFCDALRQWAFVSYFCVGAEWSSTVQGYIELVRQLSCSTVKAALPRAKILKRRGSPEQAAVYCKKDGNFLENGTRSSPGTRSDLHHVAASIIAGDSMSSVASSNPEMFIRYHRGMWALRNITVPDRVNPPEVRVYFGATGTGKSCRARQWLSDAPCYIHFSNQRGWFDGYQGERNCIFEEFRGHSDIALPHLLMILDRYPARVEVKGSFTMFSASQIAFTSPFHPELWYPSFADREDYGQLARRISSIFDCSAFPFRRDAEHRDLRRPQLAHQDPALDDAAGMLA